MSCNRKPSGYKIVYEDNCTFTNGMDIYNDFIEPLKKKYPGHDVFSYFKTLSQVILTNMNVKEKMTPGNIMEISISETSEKIGTSNIDNMIKLIEYVSNSEIRTILNEFNRMGDEMYVTYSNILITPKHLFENTLEKITNGSKSFLILKKDNFFDQNIYDEFLSKMLPLIEMFFLVDDDKFGMLQKYATIQYEKYQVGLIEKNFYGVAKYLNEHIKPITLKQNYQDYLNHTKYIPWSNAIIKMFEIHYELISKYNDLNLFEIYHGKEVKE